MRRPILAANWKMQMTPSEGAAYVDAFLPLVADCDGADVVIAPPFTALDRVGRALAGSPVALAAQNVNAEEKGAFTGEIAAGMLVDVGCRFAIVGHSERRALYAETSETVARKARTLLDHGLQPIICIGETLEEREAGRTRDVVGEQLDTSLSSVPAASATEVVVAYEPVWAIGTGRTATPAMAQEVHAFVRERLAARVGDAAAQIRIQYGGSVKPENAKALLAEPDVDGALVGGASLDPESFAQIVKSGCAENGGKP